MQPGELQYDMIPKRTRDGHALRQGRNVMPGPADTYIAYGLSWANASNTPFREYKHWVHEGGIATPLIAHWPGGIVGDRKGKLDHQPGHLIDVMATCVDVAGATYPKQYRGQRITPPEGVSLRPALEGRPLERANPIFWEHEANCAMRDGKWKLVRKGNMGTGETQPWELYDMEADRTELNNLADEEPDRLEAMSQAWEAWAERALVKPWPWRRKNTKANRKRRFELQAGADLHQDDAPQVGDEAFHIEARLDAAGQGVIVAQGGVSHGYSLYVEQGKPVFATRHSGTLTVIPSTEPLPEGASVVSVSLAASGEVAVQIDGRVAATAKTPGTVRTPIDGLTVGQDGGDPVGPYQGPQAFSGKISRVTIKLGS
jgi:arylsulfatase